MRTTETSGISFREVLIIALFGVSAILLNSGFHAVQMKIIIADLIALAIGVAMTAALFIVASAHV